MRSRWLLLLPILAAAIAPFAQISTDRAQAAPSTCFGRAIDRVVRADGVTVRAGYREVIRVEGRRTTVVGKAYSVVCAGAGPQTIRAGKGRALIDSGPGDDRIILAPASNRNIVRAGAGDDFVRGANGHDTITAGPSIKSGDRDWVSGGGGNDRIRDFGGTGNRLFGDSGSDRLFSLGRAVSTIHGGNGTDFLFSNGGSRDGSIERLFGERGNDRLRADRAGGTGGAFLDPGAGDDWVWGTDRSDTIIYSSGIKKIDAKGGDDLVITAGRGGQLVTGGRGRDTISFAAHTPPGYRRSDGVFVDLAEGYSIGANRLDLDGFEDVIGSSFDDEIRGAPGTDNELEGGLGDDFLIGNRGDSDVADGGLGLNSCAGFSSTVDCNGSSPGDFGSSKPVVEIDESGVLALIGSSRDDQVVIGYDPKAGRYVVNGEPEPATGGLCRPAEIEGGPVTCPAPRSALNGLLAYGAGGDDRIRLGDSVPAQLTTTINGGSGRNVLVGGRSKDYIASDEGTSSGTVIDGRGGADLLYLRDDVEVSGGRGSDVIHVVDPCVGGRLSGGPDKDNLVFASAGRGVRADLGRAYAEWAEGGCPSDRLKMAHDVEDLEGSRFDDILILGRRFRTQDGAGGLLGRQGIDVLDSRNGRRDTVTVGSGGRGNIVRADGIDRIVWGWGLAGF